MVARIFLCHASDDKTHVHEVYHCLRAIEGFEPWLDEEDLLPHCCMVDARRFISVASFSRLVRQ
jgi:hypothetical protein